MDMYWRKNIKSILLLTILLAITILGHTQCMSYNDGSTLTIAPGISLHLDEMGFSNQTNVQDGLIDNNGDIYVEGNWLNNATGGEVFTNLDEIGNTYFSGTTEQILGGNRVTIFENLSINNSSSTGVVMLQPATVNVSLKLYDGYVYSESPNVITLVDDATSNEGSNESFVDGMFVKQGDDPFIFPVGANGVWARFGISGPPDSSAMFRVLYVDDAHPDVENLEDVENISFTEHWLISGSTGTASVRPTLYWEDGGRSGIEDITELKIAKYDGSWKDETQIDEQNGFNDAYGNASSGFITGKNMQNYSSITFASGSKSTNPLPIELMSFEAKLENEQVGINWVTASEVNNDYFTVERSRDGYHFDEVLIESGAGNSNSVNSYFAYDESPIHGQSYYRLKQTDFDGQFTYSGIVPIFFELQNSNALVVYPNPSDQNQIYADVNGSNEDSILMIEIINSQGHTVFKKYINLHGITAQIDLDPSLPRGVYHVFTTVGTQRLQQKFIRN